MYLPLPDDLHLSEETLRQVLAVALYRRGLASPEQAGRLAGLAEADLRALAATDESASAYGLAAFEEDLATLAEHGVT